MAMELNIYRFYRDAVVPQVMHLLMFLPCIAIFLKDNTELFLAWSVVLLVSLVYTMFMCSG